MFAYVNISLVLPNILHIRFDIEERERSKRKSVKESGKEKSVRYVSR